MMLPDHMAGLDIIEQETRRVARLIEEQMERAFRASLPFDPTSFPRYLTPFPMGTIPTRYLKPIKNRLSNQHRKWRRQVRKATKMMQAVYVAHLKTKFLTLGRQTFAVNSKVDFSF